MELKENNSAEKTSNDTITPNESDKNSNTTTGDKNNNNNKEGNNIRSNSILVLCISLVILGLSVEMANIFSKIDNNVKTNTKPTYWVYGDNKANLESPTGTLKQVHTVLRRAGLEKSTNESNWILCWAHDAIFNAMPQLKNLKPHQKVNHIPGAGFITNKVDLAITESEYIPKAFKLPQDVDEFLRYAAENKGAMFLEKNNQHRGVILKNVSEIDVVSGNKFVQEYVQKLFLVDGHMFDIGVYVVVTSVNPLRVYWYKGDVLFRFCKEKLHPIDPLALDKYVIGDNYLPSWQVPSLAKAMNELGYGMKDAFDMYARSQGKNPDILWDNVQKAISEIFFLKEKFIVNVLKDYKSKNNYFEMMRFDLLVDQDMQAHLLEANMSPNLSAAKYPKNQLLYQQVLYSLFPLVGVSGSVDTTENESERLEAQTMKSADKNVAVWAAECSTICSKSCNASSLCSLCKPCRTVDLTGHLLRAHTEHLHRGDFRRLIPSPMEPGAIKTEEIQQLTPANKLLHLWYQGKCNADVTWCT